MPATKSQDGIGLCYGFSSTTLLENYRCRTQNVNCLDASESLSPMDVSSYYRNTTSKSVQESGNANKVLNNIKKSNRKIVKESCAKYSSLVKKANSLYVPDEGQGWRYLTSIWNALKAKSRTIPSDQVSCIATTIKNEIKGLSTPVWQIQDAIKTADSLENFLYKTIVPLECMNENNMISIPDFDVKSFPAYGANYTAIDLSNKIENVLMNNIPVEISICTNNTNDVKCPDGYGHSVTLFAIKEACNPLGECRTMVRVKNSYGWGWQRDNGDGWVDLNSLAKSSMRQDSFNNINWIQKPGTVLSSKMLERTGYNTDAEVIKSKSVKNDDPKIVPKKYKDFQGIFKCPNNTYLDHYEEGCVPYMEMK
jgi:hypothetical protein